MWFTINNPEFSLWFLMSFGSCYDFMRVNKLLSNSHLLSRVLVMNCLYIDRTLTTCRRRNEPANLKLLQAVTRCCVCVISKRPVNKSKIKYNKVYIITIIINVSLCAMDLFADLPPPGKITLFADKYCTVKRSAVFF